MSKLFKVNTDKYVFVDNLGKKFEGDELDVISRLVKYGIPVRDVTHSIECLEKHDVAEFGINRSFLFSKKIA